jgi:hypothetical protein
MNDSGRGDGGGARARVLRAGLARPLERNVTASSGDGWRYTGALHMLLSKRRTDERETMALFSWFAASISPRLQRQTSVE